MKTRTLFQHLCPKAVPLSLFGDLAPKVAALDEAVPQPADTAPHGGYLFAEGPAIVDHLLSAMREEPDLFAGFPDPAELRDRQDRARGWLWLQRSLQALADRAGALHQLEQSAATQEGLTLLREVRAGATRRLATATDQARLQALCMAEALASAWQRRLKSKSA